MEPGQADRTLGQELEGSRMGPVVLGESMRPGTRSMEC
jgi:hypothetical protein